MTGRVPSEPGSSPPGQAPAGLVASRGDPSRKVARVCTICAGPISRHSGSGMCRQCRYSDRDGRGARIASLREGGATLREIGRQIGVSKQAVYQALGRIAPPPSDEALMKCRNTIAAYDAISRRRALAHDESLALERAIRLEGKYDRALKQRTA